MTDSTKLRGFDRTVRRSPQVLLCVGCGSAQVEQAALDRLVCGDCGNSIAWDGLSFALVPAPGMRPNAASMKAARKAFTLRDAVPPWISAIEVERDQESQK